MVNLVNLFLFPVIKEELYTSLMGLPRYRAGAGFEVNQVNQN